MFLLGSRKLACNRLAWAHCREYCIYHIQYVEQFNSLLSMLLCCSSNVSSADMRRTTPAKKSAMYMHAKFITGTTRREIRKAAHETIVKRSCHGRLYCRSRSSYGSSPPVNNSEPMLVLGLTCACPSVEVVSWFLDLSCNPFILASLSTIKACAYSQDECA